MASTQVGSGYRTSQGTSSSSSFAGIENQDVLRELLKLIASGGVNQDYLNQRATRDAATKDLMGRLNSYTTDAAFSDAADLMKLNLQQSYEKQMPAIQKSVQGAGTSASSMQGLLSSKLATDAALSAGALGAEQAKAYAQAQTGLQGVLEKFTSIDNTQLNNLLKAIELSRVDRKQQSAQESSFSTESNNRTETDPVSAASLKNSMGGRYGDIPGGVSVGTINTSIGSDGLGTITTSGVGPSSIDIGPASSGTSYGQTMYDPFQDANNFGYDWYTPDTVEPNYADTYGDLGYSDPWITGE